MSEITANYDEPWKEALGEYFPEFLTFFFSDIYDLIDWTKKPISLEKELQIKTKATISNLTEREQWKWFFIRSLYEKGYSKKQIVKLFKFIDLMMTLPKQLQQSLVQKINDYEEEKTMPLLSTMEQMAMERGELKGELKLITRQLNRKFGQLNSDLESQIQALNIDDLEQLGEDLFDLDSLDDLQKWLLNFKD